VSVQSATYYSVGFILCTQHSQKVYSSVMVLTNSPS